MPGDEPWHALPTDKVYEALGSGSKGLTKADAAARLDEHGPNELKKATPLSPFRIFLGQFNNFLIYLLLGAMVVSIVVGEYLDASIIGAIILLNALIGAYQEIQANRSIESLKKYLVREASVVRDGRLEKVEASTLVPGDVIQVEAGDSVPADARVTGIAGLAVDESALTGEPEPAVKETGVQPAGTPIADRQNMLFAGTMATAGRSTAIVVKTGMDTEIGRIASLVEAGVKRETPVQISLDLLGKVFAAAAIVTCVIIFIAGLIEGRQFIEMFIVAVSLAVAAIPEGLPATVTIIFALGVQRMARRKAIVMRLAAVETLGSTSVICSDKTGTLTQNIIVVRQLVTASATLGVTGNGYAGEGEFLLGGRRVDVATLPEPSRLLKAAVLCNNAVYEHDARGMNVLGDSTEVALLVAGVKAGISPVLLGGDCPREFEEPFSSDTRFMLTVNRCESNFIVYAKGAPEVMLDMCTHLLVEGSVVPMSGGQRERFGAENQAMAGQGMRVLGFAFRLDADPLKEVIGNLRSDLVFIGLTGMIDPPRPEAKRSIELCKQSGIDVVMITGDQATTAVSIAGELGIYEAGDEAVAGSELAAMDDGELDRRISRIKVFARTSPEQKMRIVESLQKNGHVVAMTGDGVNDAPALKRSDIGVSMGLNGTEVARQASDMVLADDNFATIVSAVEEGRTLYDNVRKAVIFLFSGNLGEVLTIFIGIMINLPLPLLAIQILWVNLITDSLPSLALGMDPADKRAMSKPPRPRSEGIITGRMALDIALVGLIIGLGTLWLFYRSLPSGLDYARTMAFSGLVVFQILNAFNCKSQDKSLFHRDTLNNLYLWGALAVTLVMLLAIIYLPPMQILFRTVSLGLGDWTFILAVTALVLVAIELRKLAEFAISAHKAKKGAKNRSG